MRCTASSDAELASLSCSPLPLSGTCGTLTRSSTIVLPLERREQQVEEKRRIALDRRARASARASRARASSAEVRTRSRPSFTRALSTAPSRPANVVYTGTPSATASRFIVPPAETTRSASATRLSASIACSGTTSGRETSSEDVVALLGGPRKDDGAHVFVATRAARERRRTAGFRAGGTATHRAACGRRRARARESSPSSSSTARSGSKPASVVLLLQARVAAHFRSRARRGRSSRSCGIASGTIDAPSRAAAEPVLHPRELVVERVGRGDAERARDEWQLVRGVRKRDVEVATLREPSQRAETAGRRPSLADDAGSAMAGSDDLVRDPVQLEELDRLRVLPRRHVDVVPALVEERDQSGGRTAPAASWRCRSRRARAVTLAVSRISFAYGHASARRFLRRRRAPQLLPGGGAARRHPARRVAAGARAREAARNAASRPLGSARGADGGGLAPLPRRAADARARGSARRRRGRVRRGRPRGRPRPRRLDGPGGCRRAGRARRVPAPEPRRPRVPHGLRHALRRRARRGARARARHRRRGAPSPRRSLRAVLLRRGHPRLPARPLASPAGR